MSQFANKVVIVTGGTSGIGRATAIAFGAQGASVVISGRRESEGAESVALVEKAGGKAIFIRTDVSKEADLANLVEKTVEKFGQLDIAFNNAGYYGPYMSTADVTEELYEKTFDINVRGVLFAMKHEIPAMLKAGGGAIVNTSSALGLRPKPYSAIYNATKFAVIGLTQSTALEYAAQGIRVNAVCPAIIETEMTANLINNPEMNAQAKALHPVGRFGVADEIAAAVLYLCGPNSGFTTGIAMPVDGGFSV